MICEFRYKDSSISLEGDTGQGVVNVSEVVVLSLEVLVLAQDHEDGKESTSPDTSELCRPGKEGESPEESTGGTKVAHVSPYVNDPFRGELSRLVVVGSLYRDSGCNCEEESQSQDLCCFHYFNYYINLTLVAS